jgi:diguanylate cyclase (GGDEF)-like protein
MIRKDGRVVWIRDEAVLVHDGEGRPRFWQGIMMDITERKVLEDRLSHQAMHDPLTGLPNRVLLSDRLMRALSRAGRRGNEAAVLFLDLDNFKYVNDSLGHGAGDRLLVGVARRLARVIRPEDTLARLGGDEFVVLLEDVGARAEAFRIAARIQDALRTPITLDDREYFLTTSIGIAFGGNVGDHPEDLLRDADAAMYRAKEAGKDQHAVFRPEMQERSLRRLGLEGDLRRVLKAPEKELRVFYQPKALIETGGIVGTEALVRWEHPERGLVLPAEFIPLAEETGMIVPLGRWVLVEACRQTKEWQLEHPADPPLFVNVNLSACQFRDPGLARDVRDALVQTDLAPESLILEITESTLMEDASSTLDTLRWLKDLGVRLAIDDFGTGYSSLSYLKRFPVDAIKIDRSIISGLERDSGNAAIVSATITLAHALGLEAVAEGVEAEGELAELHRLGCDLGQGYYFWRPASAEKTSALLAAESRRPQSRIRHL